MLKCLINLQFRLFNHYICTIVINKSQDNEKAIFNNEDNR